MNDIDTWHWHWHGPAVFVAQWWLRLDRKRAGD
jgi:hypothetical protein